MTPQVAEKLVNAYGGALAAGAEGTARPMSLLPASKIKIRHAFYVYLAELVRRQALTEDLGSSLVAAYNGIDTFIPDETAEKFNNIEKIIRKEAEENSTSEIDSVAKKEHMDFLIEAYGSMSALTEINDYIRECQAGR